MDDLRLLGIGLEIARHTVAEAHTDGDEHIALLFLEIDGIVTVHTQHTSVERMIGGQCRETEHRAACRDIGFLEELDEFTLGIAEFDTLPYQSQGLLGIVDQFGSPTHGFGIKFRIGHIGAYEIHLHRLPVDLLDLRIAREVEHHGTWAPCAGSRPTPHPRHDGSDTTTSR